MSPGTAPGGVGVSRGRGVASPRGRGACLPGGASDGKVRALEGESGALKWVSTDTAAGAIWSCPAVGDVDGDGAPEIVVSSDDKDT